jgi:hypothetical protein
LPASAFALALAASQSDFDIDTQPVPLQLFWPLQLFLADLHSLVPLHEFTPVQCTVAAVSAATDTPANPDVNNIAAAAAIAAVDTLLICMVLALKLLDVTVIGRLRSAMAAPVPRPDQGADYYSIV